MSAIARLERAGNRLALYQACRVFILSVIFVSLALWGITGFDIAEGSVPLIGIQWSTFATFFFFFYLLSVNYHVGGLKNFRQLGREMKLDLLRLFGRVSNEQYPNWDYVVNPYAALLTAFCVCLGCLFLFEDIWVPLYDYFQFGSIMWPVYSAAGPWMARNILLAAVPLGFAFFGLPTMMKLNGILHNDRIYFTRWRFGEGWTSVLLIAAGCWLTWITWPHTAQPLLILPTIAKSVQYVAGACYIWPSMGYFPQNTYTFYPCGLYGQHYPLTDILSGFAEDAGIHAINVVTKFCTFAAVCYPFMAVARRPA